jgi:hypothetical protein
MLKPIQLKLSKDKDATWIKESAYYYRDSISFLDSKEIETQLAISCGRLKEIDYKYVTNPYSIKDEKKSMPAKIKNWSFIHTILLQLLGEFIERSFEPMVYNKSSEVADSRNKIEHELSVKRVSQYLVNALIKVGFYVPNQTDEQGNPIKDPISEEEINKEVESMIDQKTKFAQDLLNYELSTKNVIDELVPMWWFFCTTKYAVSYKDIINDNVVYKHVKPNKFGYIPSGLSNFIEDSEAVRYREQLSMSDLISLLGEKEGFDEIREILLEQYEYLKEDSKGSVTTDTTNWLGQFMRNSTGKNSVDSSVNNSNMDIYTVDHIQWTSTCYMYRVYRKNLFGQDEYVDNDDTYIPTKTDIYEKRVCNETWEAWIIADEYVVGGQPIENSRGDYNNPHVSKKSYNGLRILPFLDEAKSITELLNVYQEAHNIVKYKAQVVINKSKEKIMTLPLSLINGLKSGERKMVTDSDGGIRNEKVHGKDNQIANSLYYADATSFLFVDDSDLTPQQAQVAAQLLKQVDLSSGQYLDYLIRYAETIKMEAEESVGFNRARKGRTGERDAVSNTQQMQYVGSLITEEFFREFNTLIERDCLGIVELSRYLHNTGLSTVYLNKSYEEQTLNIPPEGISLMNIGIVIRNGGKESRALGDLRARALEFSQNGSSPSVIAKILNPGRSYTEIENILEKKEQEIMQQNQQAMQSQQEAAQGEQQLKQYEIDEKNKASKYKVDSDAKIELIKMGVSDNGEFDKDLKVMDMANKNKDSDFKNKLDIANLMLKNKEADIKNQEIKTNLAIAKENKP